MRQLAWLNARPDKAEGDKSTTPEPSRRDRLKTEGVGAPALPHCRNLYLVDYLFEMGPAMATGMGEAPVPHSEIAAWQANTAISLTPWEARTLRALSVAYCAEAHRAKDRKCPAPWQSDSANVEKLVKANEQKNAFRQLANL